MALSATIHKIDMSLADMDTHRYGNYSLTVAQHPSETAERVMVRVFGFAMFAQEGLSFGRGISTDEDPDLQLIDLTGALECGILVGLPDEKLVRQYCGKADRVVVLAFGKAKLDVWWRRSQSALRKLNNLSVHVLPPNHTEPLADLLNRSMRLSVTVQDGEYLVSSSDGTVTVVPDQLQVMTKH